MTLKKVLKEQLDAIKPGKEDVLYLKSLTRNFIEALRKGVKDEGYKADVFIGGSYAKGTLVKKYDYDIDVFVRFDWKYDEISGILEKILKRVNRKLKYKLERLHGSRDYFRMHVPNEGHYFEIIPVTKIKHPREEKNVTDLSYFHVPYIKRKIKGKEDELLLAKTFCHAQKVYGAETYVSGFSGYALECLIVYYGSFGKMLRELSKVKIGERLVIDIEKKYKKKSEVFFELNENKLHSPVILIDPTYKERNALASLKQETFEKFQKSAKKFLKKPSKDFFVEKQLDVLALEKKAKKNKSEFLHVKIKTSKQAGDIAGTKLKKFFEFLHVEIDKYFKVSEKEFVYDENQGADLYYIAKSRKEVVRIGPPLHMKKHVRAFKKEHRSTYEKNKFIHAKMKITFGLREFVDVWKKQRANKKTMEEMSITDLKII